MPKTFLKAVNGGFLIGLAGWISLNAPGDPVWLKSFLFAVGLFAVLATGGKLYTGVCGHLLDDLKSPKDTGTRFRDALIVWLGNLAGAFSVSLLYTAKTYSAAHMTMFGNEGLMTVSGGKYGEPLYELFFGGIVCGVLICFAVDVWNNKAELPEADNFMKISAVIMAVMAFILSGAEHCVADMYYVFQAGFVADGALLIVIVTLGNTVGGLIMRWLLRIGKAPIGRKPL
jgi:formate/nitrite transporter FocA (FNT family)